MLYRVMKVDPADGTSLVVFTANDERGAMYQAVGLLGADPPLPMFWVENPDGIKIADPKAISDYADQHGYPNVWRARREIQKDRNETRR
jgi:hypothetical protein